MKTFRLLLLSLMPLFAFSGCPTEPERCSPENCTAGCCDSAGQCQLGAANDACGTGGQLCTACFPGQLCSQGLCMNTGTGGGMGNGGGAGGGTGGGAGGGSTGPLMCSGGRTACSGTCVDTSNDERNCGFCGTLCNSNQFCSGGMCTNLPANCAGGCPSGFFCTTGNECKPGCSTNADCPAPGMCDTRTNSCSCVTGFHQCGQTCEADNNTSACGPSCASCEGIQNAQPACTNNRCDFTCNPGLHRCGNECVSDNDIATCGTSCTPCQPPPNSVAICANQQCDFVCNSGFHRCGNACVDNTSVSSCGATSCSPCTPPPNGTATCNGFACDFTCNSGFHRCGNSCVSNTSINSCGSSCSPCVPPPSSTATCDGVSCGFTCNTGSHGCNGQCVSNLSTNSCGTTSCVPCSPPLNGTATCNGIACDFTCNSGTHRCGATCADNTSINACGTSCTPCPNGPANSSRTCNGTTCGWQCNAGYHDCGGACVPDSSVTQCGLSCTMCPAVANASPVCTGGACDFVCNTGFHRCGNACVSNTSVDSCGTSCTPCPNGPANSTRTCNGSTCGFQCGGGFNACGGECVAPDFASACGSACSACTATGTFDRPICSGGSCGTACITSCNSACVDVTRDAMNCGSCGTPCTGGQVCTSGECRAACTTGPAFEGALPYVNVAQTSFVGFRILADDLNGDGRVDLVDNAPTNGLNVRYSNADGTFQAPVLVGTSTLRPNAFALVDLNGDGRKDLVATIARTSTSNLFMSLNNGTGFNTASTHLMSGYTPSGVVLVGDFSGDTRPDIIVPSTSTYTFYWTQSATGTFTSSYTTYSSNTFANVTNGRGVVADFNRDGRLEFAVASTSQIQVVLNNGGSLTVQPTAAFTVQTAITASGVVLETGDLNGDLNPDLIWRSSSSGGSYALGTGTGTFGSSTALTFSGSGTSPIVPVDLNGDGMTDLLSGTTGGVTLALASAQGVWPSPSTRLTNAPPASHVSVAVGQLIGSAAPEIISASQATSTSNQIGILINEGGTAPTFPGARASGTSLTSTAAAAGDVDGDGDRDLVVTGAIATNGSGTGSVLLGSNNGGFGGASSTVTLRGDELALGRLNGDAFADLVAIIESTSVPGVDVFLAGSGGAFGAPTRLATTALPTRVVIANVDGDSINDVLVGTAAGVEWFRGNGDGTFGAARSVGAAQGTVQAFGVGDLNLDGRVDLVINSGATAAVRVYLGYGMGNFQLAPFASYPSVSTATDVIVADLDRDARPDVAVGSQSGVLLFRGEGNGVLQARTTQSTMIGRLVSVDLDNDGSLDLITIGGGEVGVARGQANLTFLPRQAFAPGRSLAPTVVLADRFNNDTFLDVLGFSTGTEVWTWLGMCR